MDGNGMIVCMSRRICLDLHDAITALRPQWHDEGDEKRFVKVIMTAEPSEGPRVTFHARNKARRERLATKFKVPDDRSSWYLKRQVRNVNHPFVDRANRK